MDFREFLEEMADVLEVEDVTESLEFDKDVFDSLAVVSTIALIDEYFDVTVNGKQLANSNTVADILDLIKKAKGEE